MDFSAELTFIPSKPPYEITSLKEGNALIRRLNKELISLHKKYGLFVFAKLDPFHLDGLQAKTYCVEIIPYDGLCWSTDFFSKKFSPTDFHLFKNGLKKIFKICKKNNLKPLIIKKSKGKTIHYPSGGCHLHFSADLFYASQYYYKDLENFNKNIIADYANKPYIRWLFAQWFDNNNSLVIFNERQLREEPKVDRDFAFQTSFCEKHAIVPRFMRSQKRCYNTFEFRFINMVENFSEFETVTQTIEAWIQSIIFKDFVEVEISYKDFSNFKNPVKAKKLCVNWIKSINLEWDENHEKFWNRNYKNRILKGELL